MKTVQFYADTNRSDNLLHIETDGCIVNIHVGLTDNQGRRVTSVSISPEDKSRGGDGEGRMWSIAGDSGPGNIRIIRAARFLAKISEPTPRLLSSDDATREFDDASDAWNWLYEQRRDQMDTAGIGGSDEDPYDGDETLRDLNAKTTVSFNVREGWDPSDRIEGDTPGWNPDDGRDPGLTYSVEILED